MRNRSADHGSIVTVEAKLNNILFREGVLSDWNERFVCGISCESTRIGAGMECVSHEETVEGRNGETTEGAARIRRE